MISDEVKYFVLKFTLQIYNEIKFKKMKNDI